MYPASRTEAQREAESAVTARAILLFLFQAEDGIRDYKVTGVQTCALPISQPAPAGPEKPREGLRDAVTAIVNEHRSHKRSEPVDPLACDPGAILFALQLALDARSEERRVGNKARSRWWP